MGWRGAPSWSTLATARDTHNCTGRFRYTAHSCIAFRRARLTKSLRCTPIPRPHQKSGGRFRFNTCSWVPVLGAQQLHSLSEQRRARETTGATAVWTLTHTGAHLLHGEVATVDDNVAPGLHGGVRSGHALFAIAAAAFVDGVLVHSNPRVRRKAAAQRALACDPRLPCHAQVL